MIRVRDITIDDYEELVDMMYSFISETNTERVQKPKYFYHRFILDSIRNSKRTFIVTYNDDCITGFASYSMDSFDNLLDEVVNAEYAYVKESYRGSRSAYLLYNYIYKLSKELQVGIISQGKIDNGVSDMMQKHFNMKPKYIFLEGDKHE